MQEWRGTDKRTIWGEFERKSFNSYLFDWDLGFKVWENLDEIDN